MSEEIKDIILDVKDSLNETPKNMYKYNKITLNLNEFEEILNYIEQLEKENKELKYDCSYSFHDAEELNQKLMEIIDERNELDTKLIQLENIRKETIEYIENPRHEMSVLTYQNLLNILNKGDNKE